MRIHIEADGVSVGFQGLAWGRRKRMREVALLAIDMVTARGESAQAAVMDAALEMMVMPDDVSDLEN